jgi:hypothetical protein
MTENTSPPKKHKNDSPKIIKKSPSRPVANNSSLVPDAGQGNGSGFKLPTKVLTVSSPRIATMIKHVLSVSRADNIIAGNFLRRDGFEDTNTSKANALIESAMKEFEEKINKAHSLLRKPSRNPSRKAGRSK